MEERLTLSYASVSYNLRSEKEVIQNSNNTKVVKAIQRNGPVEN